ncbi:cation diffusion facilitator family transporter [Geobacter sp. DSM 9736]|uniref:cation diffusion facilitator family transporter n=1 Tax=Geobacter sp. DSM 9736 TaxID=1277350 RepID=UPI000B4FF5C0|nr:cation diffusion facilitator family transporter [Geobacter sp. DSM 9736]SNB44827.1 cation diffusion facilitator family transporter [Geobacter sp. DSM 9736]
MQRNERFGEAEQVIRIGFLVNALLMTGKILAGYFGRSEAVLADGVESACDFIAIFSTMVALRIGRKPFDEEHPYGHGKAESISAVIVSIIIFGTGAGILYRSARSIILGGHETPGFVAVAAALLTIITKEWLFRYSIRKGARLESPAIIAIARDHRKDALTSIATLIGVTAAFFGFGAMDPIAAGITSLFIFHIGWVTFRSAAHDLMDALPSQELVSAITLLAEGVEGVEHVHEIKARRSGQYVIVDLKLDMDPEMTVKNSHAIATHVKRLIFEKFPNVGDVMIHINPHEEQHEDLIRL